MGFSIYETDPAGLENFYNAVIKNHETYAPVESFGKFTYERIQPSATYHLNPPIKNTFSIKPLFFPQTTEVLRFKENSDGVQVLPPSEDPLTRKKVVLGVKMCDAQAIKVLEGVARWDYVDEDFMKRRESTVLIAGACEQAEKNCFCTSLDFDFEKSDAFDVLVVKGADNACFLKAATSRGEEFLREAAKSLKQGGNGVEDRIHQQFKKFSGSFKKLLDYQKTYKALKEGFESPEFDEYAKLCISCNTCSFSCPTCHCFKVTDEKVKDTGVRYKCYDACACGNFTLMAGGHNPRPEKRRRWRQRAMHKFVYYKERFGTNLCVGCGRCVSFCPVNIDIFDVVNTVAKSGGKK